MAAIRSYRWPVRKYGFTLLELLIVILIIGLLTCILVPCLIAMKETARQAVCLAHLRSVGASVEAYRTEYGTYPHAGPPETDWQPCPERQLLQTFACQQQEVLFCPSDRPSGFVETPSLFEDEDTGLKVQELFWPGRENDGKPKYARQMDRFDRAPPFEWLQSSYMWNECILEDARRARLTLPADIGLVSEGNHVVNRRDWACLIAEKDRRRDQTHWRETVNVLFGDGHADSVPPEQAAEVPSDPMGRL